jgi:hypothetical protein
MAVVAEATGKLKEKVKAKPFVRGGKRWIFHDEEDRVTGG